MTRWRSLVAAAAALSALSAPVARAESLYDEGAYRALTSDRRAFQVGDAITIQVVENSSASTTADTSTQRKNGVDANVTILNLLNPQGGTAGVGGTFAGGGTTQHANRVLATLTVSVREVLPSGELRVGGQQVVTVNGESRTIDVEGRVRPLDVSADNVVASTRLADARIAYAGDGDLSERGRRAWWRKALDWLGL